MLLLSNAVCTVAVPLLIEMKLVLSVTKLLAPLLMDTLDASNAQEPLCRAAIAWRYCTESLWTSILSSAARLRSLSARQAASFSLRVIFFSCADTLLHITESNSSKKIRYWPMNDGRYLSLDTGDICSFSVDLVNSFITFVHYGFSVKQISLALCRAETVL